MDVLLILFVVFLPINLTILGMIIDTVIKSDKDKLIILKMSEWLSPKIILSVIVIVCICWNVYKMRCAYEEKCQANIKAYSTLVSEEK